MCGRFIQVDVEGDMSERFDPAQLPLDLLQPRYNLAPTQQAVVALNDDRGPHLEAMRWGLVPFWASDLKVGARMINARAEGIEEKPAFRAAVKRRRCLVPATGFYEWRKEGRTRHPYCIRGADGKPLWFAGIWETWDKEGAPVRTFSIITTAANELMAGLHDRMPVILGRDEQDRWLREGDVELLRPCPSAWLSAYPVDSRVGKVSEQGASLMEPVGEPWQAGAGNEGSAV